MNTYQIVLKSNWDIVFAHIVTNSTDRAIELFDKYNVDRFTIKHELICLNYNVTDKRGNPIKEKITIVKVYSYCKYGDKCPSEGAYDLKHLCDIGYKKIN